MRDKTFFNVTILVLLVSLFLFTPLGDYKRIVIIGALFLLWIISSLSLNRKSMSETVPLVIVLVLITFLQYVYSTFPGKGDEFRRFCTNFILTYIWGILGVFYASNLDVFKKCLPFLVIMVTVSCAYTITGNLIMPNASRMLAGAEEEGSQMYVLMHSMHIGGYDFIYALVYALFPTVLWYKYRLRFPFLVLLFIVLIMGTLIVGSYFTSIAMAIAIIILSLSNTKNTTTFFVTVGVLSLFVLIFKDVLLQWLYDFGVAIDSHMLQMRAQEMLEGSYQEDADAIGQYSRVDRLMNGFHNILQSPISGRMTYSSLDLRASSHSDLLGYFERYGLFGFLYIYYYQIIFKKIQQKAVTVEIRRIITLLFVFFYIFLFLDTFDIANATGCMLFLIAPCTLLYIEKMLIDKSQQKAN